MVRMILVRLATAVPVILVVAVFVFLMVRLGASDPAVILVGDHASPETLAEIRHQLGLDRPIWEQFLIWAGSILQGDLGRSIASNLSVGRLILQRVEPTLSLTLTTLLFASVVAIPLGILASWQRGRLTDRLIMLFSTLGFSLPVFVLGYVLILVFAVIFPVLPVQGFTSITEGIGPFLRNIALPTLALSLIYMALLARITRSAMLEVLGEDYVKTARAKGLSEFVVLVRHALRNAAVPIISVIGLGFAMMVGGVVVTETVFNIPGLGRLVVDAVLARDYPVIQGVILVFSLLYIFINLLIDISYILLDPRIRH